MYGIKKDTLQDLQVGEIWYVLSDILEAIYNLNRKGKNDFHSFSLIYKTLVSTPLTHK